MVEGVALMLRINQESSQNCLKLCKVKGSITISIANGLSCSPHSTYNNYLVNILIKTEMPHPSFMSSNRTAMLVADTFATVWGGRCPDFVRYQTHLWGVRLSCHGKVWITEHIGMFLHPRRNHSRLGETQRGGTVNICVCVCVYVCVWVCTGIHVARCVCA